MTEPTREEVEILFERVDRRASEKMLSKEEKDIVAEVKRRILQRVTEAEDARGTEL